MFSKLDTSADLFLDQMELAAINLDKYEVCIRPFFNSCDTYKDGHVSTAEWCFCFWRESECRLLSGALAFLHGLCPSLQALSLGVSVAPAWPLPRPRTLTAHPLAALSQHLVCRAQETNTLTPFLGRDPLRWIQMLWVLKLMHFWRPF